MAGKKCVGAISCLVAALSCQAIIAHADTVRVVPSEPYPTLEAAVAASSAGDTIELLSGVFLEDLTISVQDLTFRGPNAGVSAGTEPGNRKEEAVIRGQLSISATGFSIDGVRFERPEGAYMLRALDSGSVSPFEVEARNTIFDLSDGEGRGLGSAAYGAASWTLVDNLFTGQRIDTFHPDSRMVYITGGASVLERNRFIEIGHAVYLAPGGEGGCRIANNLFRETEESIFVGTDGNLIEENVFEAGIAIHVVGANVNTIRANRFEAEVEVTAWFDESHSGNTLVENRILAEGYGSWAGSFFEGYTVFNLTEGTEVDAVRNWWNAEDAEEVERKIRQLASDGDTLFDPWYVDEQLTHLKYGGALDLTAGDTIEKGYTVTVLGLLTIGDGVAPARLTVYGTLNAGTIDVRPEAALEVIDGTLALGAAAGGTHTMSGTFTLYHNLGSIHIGADTVFSGDSLMLISDIYVSDGVTLTVSGSLILDGCTVLCADGGGRFTIEVTETGVFQMIRTTLFDADLELKGTAGRVRDNLLTDVAITVTGVGNEVFHNVFFGTTLLVDDGSGTVTEVDGWDNVTAMEETRNRFTLESTDIGLCATRTLDSEGQLHVQPGDVVRVLVPAWALDTKIQGTEAMLGFHTYYFDPEASTLGPVPPWEYLLHNLWNPEGVYGRIDMAIGLGIEFPDGDGTDDDGPVAAVDLRTRADVEGITQFHFRTATADDDPMAETRLTGHLGDDPFYLTPFTMNTGLITIDGTPPDIANLAGFQEQEVDGIALEVDVFDGFMPTRQGMVSITVEAFDKLAGIDEEKVFLLLTHQEDSKVTLEAMLVGTEAVAAGEETWTRYLFEVTVTEETADGIYDVEISAMDRSGNTSMALYESLEVRKTGIAVEIALQQLAGHENHFRRTVVFVATDEDGTVLARWESELDFLAGVGTVTLYDAPSGMVWLSAKTNWNLRVRLDCVPNEDNRAEVYFTGPTTLPGGDLTGDNQVAMLDYLTMQSQWFTTNPEGDIDGSGQVTMTDYLIMQANWYTRGDPL